MTKLRSTFGVGDHVVVDVLVELAPAFGEVLLGLVLREDRSVVLLGERVVGEVLDDHCGLLLVDESRSLGDELLGVLPVLGERARLNPLQDGARSSACELSLLGDLPERS